MPTTHVFESPHGDGADATQVRPSNWNDDHDVDLSDYAGDVGASLAPAANGYFSGTLYAGSLTGEGNYLTLVGGSLGILTDGIVRPGVTGVDDLGNTTTAYRNGRFTGTVYAQGASFTAGDDTPTIELQRDKGSAVLAGEQLGAISYMGHDGTALVQGADMRVVPPADWSATSHPSRILFSTTDVDETVATPRVRIDEHGDMTPHTPGVGEDGYDLGSPANPWAQGRFSGTVTAGAFNPPADVMATLRAETDTPILDYLAAGTPNPHQTKGAIIALLLLVRTLMHIED